MMCYGVIFSGGSTPMRRRHFIAILASTTAAWQLAAHAQQTERMQRIGVLMNRAANDSEG
jgi:hypothetical protein